MHKPLPGIHTSNDSFDIDKNRARDERLGRMGRAYLQREPAERGEPGERGFTRESIDPLCMPKRPSDFTFTLP